MLLYNQATFKAKSYFEQAVTYESRISYIPIASEVRQIIPYEIKQTHIELQDYDTIELDEYTELEFEDLFAPFKKDLMPYEKPDTVQISVTFEMSFSLIKQ